MTDISIREQREAVQGAAADAEDWLGDDEEATIHVARLRAAALTLAKVERGELVPKRGLTQEQIDDIGIPYFLRDYERP